MSQALPLQLKVHRGIAEIPEAAWNALLDEQSTPFLEWGFIEALEASGSACDASGWHPSHLALWQGNRLVAAAPAYVKDDSFGEFVYDWSWAAAAERVGFPYYPKLVLAVPFSPATGPRVLIARGQDWDTRFEAIMRGALELSRAEGHSGLHVLFPQAREAEALERLGFGIRHGVQYHWQNRGYRSFDGFLGELTSKRRNQIRREMKGPASQGITLETLRGEALRTLEPAEVHRIYVHTVDKHVWGRRHLTPAFFERVLGRLGHRVEYVAARREGKLIAGAFNLASNDVMYGRYWGALEEHPFLHFNVCIYHPIEQAIARGVARFEPGAGGEHKLVRGFEPALTFSAHWIFQPALDRAVREFLAHERAAIAQGLPAWRQEAGYKAGHDFEQDPSGGK
jgi:predicted N-acyltransferase